MSYEKSIKYLYDLQPIGIKFGLNNTLSLLNCFNNPHRQLMTIHVAGTNGKGSTCSMISSILQTAGYKVGLYTSPHLVDFTERISINGTPIPPQEVVYLTQRIQHAIRDGDFQSAHPTFFEVVTVMALTYFYEQGVDLAVMEVGMGGRLDATNVVQPLLGIITNIDMDHQQYLGDSLLDIAWEKAGIIKKGMPVVTGDQQPEVLQFLADICQERGAVLLPVPPPPSVTRALKQNLMGQSFEAAWPDDSTWHRFSISLLGEHQIQNALVVLSAIRALNPLLPSEIAPSMIIEGLARARWPGRVEVYPGSPTIITDGAHNPAGAHKLSLLLRKFIPGRQAFPANGLPEQALSEEQALPEQALSEKQALPEQALSEEQALPDSEFSGLILVLGIMKDKQIDKICQHLIPLASRVIFTRPGIDRACPPEKILEISQSLLPDAEKVSITGNIPEAIALARSMAAPHDLICITGSLYTVGEAKVLLDAR